MVEIIFTKPLFLWLLASIPLLIVIHVLVYKKVKKKAMLFANLDALQRVTGKNILQKNINILVIRIFILILIISSLSGATLWYETEVSDNNYILAIDASGSMLANDFVPNRLDAAKKSAIYFIDSIKSRSKVGVISFAGISYIVFDSSHAPPT